MTDNNHEKPKAQEMALRMLSRRAYSQHEIEKKLSDKGCTANDIAQTIAQLQAWGYLNDNKLQEQIVRETVRRGKGRMWLQQKLAQRGLVAADRDTQTDLDTPERALAALQRKYGTAPPQDVKDKQRRFAYLQRQGFGSAVIMKALSMK